jgi:hypothetical protein
VAVPTCDGKASASGEMWHRWATKGGGLGGRVLGWARGMCDWPRRA